LPQTSVATGEVIDNGDFCPETQILNLRWLDTGSVRVRAGQTLDPHGHDFWGRQATLQEVAHSWWHAPHRPTLPRLKGRSSAQRTGHHGHTTQHQRR